MFKRLQQVTDGVLVRLGTLLTSAFAGYGMAEHHVDVLVPAILVIAGVGVDMVTGLIVKRMGR